MTLWIGCPAAMSGTRKSPLRKLNFMSYFNISFPAAVKGKGESRAFFQKAFLFQNQTGGRTAAVRGKTETLFSKCQNAKTAPARKIGKISVFDRCK